MLKFCPSCGIEILSQSKFCHECGCSFQTALKPEGVVNQEAVTTIQPEMLGDKNLNNFFAQFAEIKCKENDQNKKQLKKAETFFLNYKICSAEPLLIELVDKGDFRAQYILGLIYENGYGGLENNTSKAVNLFSNSGDGGDALSCIHFLSFYARDEDTELVSLLNQIIVEVLDEL